MSVITGDVVASVFNTYNSSQASADADSLPSGTLYLNGASNAATVTIAHVSTGLYSFSVTMPTLAIGDRVKVEVSATIGGVAVVGEVANDACTTARNASGIVQADLQTIKTRAVTDPGGTVAIGTNVAQVGSNMGSATTVTDLGANGASLVTAVWASVADSPGVTTLLKALVPVSSTVVDPAATTTSFITGLTSSVTDFWKGQAIVFTNGALAGQLGQIAGYNGSTKAVTLQSSLTSAPANGVAFSIVNVAASRKLATIIAAADATGVLAASVNEILGTALPAESVAGRDAAAFGKLFDVAGPVLTAASVNQTGDSYGKLPASPAAVGSNMGSVTTVTDLGANGSSLVSAIWNALTSAMTTVGSIGKKLGDWVVGTITANQSVNVAQIGGQTASASAPVAFPASVGTSTYAGADTSGTTTLLTRIGKTLAYDTNGFVKVDVEDWKGSAAAALTGDTYAQLNTLIPHAFTYDGNNLPKVDVVDFGGTPVTGVDVGAILKVLQAEAVGKLVKHTPSGGRQQYDFYATDDTTVLYTVYVNLDGTGRDIV